MAQWQIDMVGRVQWYSGMVGSHQGSIRSQPQLRQCIDAYLEPAFTLPTRLSNTLTNPTTIGSRNIFSCPDKGKDKYKDKAN